MRKIRMILLLSAIFLTPAVFADHGMSMSKPCGMIAKACKDAGFTRSKEHGKKFWFNCMKPVILGKTVHGVTASPDVVKACRKDKLAKIHKELKEFEKADSQ